MSPAEADDYSVGELVRSQQRTEAAVEKLSEKLDKLITSFVPRELYEAEIAGVKKDHAALSAWVTDIAANGERINTRLGPDFKAADYVTVRTARWVVGLLASTVVGLAAALIAAVTG